MRSQNVSLSSGDTGKAGLWTHYLEAWTLGLWRLGRLDSECWMPGRLEAWTRDAWTLDDWTLGLWTTGRLDFGRLNAWTLDAWILDD